LLNPLVTLSSSVFQILYLWSHLDILLRIAKYWLWNIIVPFRWIGCLYNLQ
jgi:hypothetical protein